MFKKHDHSTAESKPKRRPGRPRKNPLPDPAKPSLRDKYSPEACDMFELETQGRVKVEDVTEEEFVKVMRRLTREKGRGFI